MTEIKEFTLPELPYEYNALEPYYDEQTLRIHHDRHHAGYVKGLNNAMKKLAEARETGDFSLIKHWEREQAFHGAGHHFHTMFWENMRPGKEENKADSELLAEIEKWFGSWEAFEKQFKSATAAVEGSGWGVLASCPHGSLHVFAVENHQKVWVPGLTPIMVCDVWEHAYYKNGVRIEKVGLRVFGILLIGNTLLENIRKLKRVLNFYVSYPVFYIYYFFFC